jgi:hypothetical protein
MAFPCKAKNLKPNDEIDLSKTRWIYSEDGPKPPVTGWAVVMGISRNEGNGREGKLDIGVSFGEESKEFIRFSVDMHQYFQTKRDK